MAVVFLDPSGQPISRRETLDFTVSTDPVAISVGFPGLRAEERCYRDGVFLYPYLGSSKAGTTFHLSRTGGWGASVNDITLYVDEGAAGPSGAAEWGLLYHVDFRVVTPVVLALGANVIDGLTWYYKAGAPGVDLHGAVMGLGTGIRWNMANPGGGVSEFSSSFFGQRLILPMANVPGFNPGAPVCFYTRFDTETASPGSTCLAGVMDCGLNGFQPSGSEMNRRQGISHGDTALPSTPQSAMDSVIWNHQGVGPRSSTSSGALNLADSGRATYVLNRKMVSHSAFRWDGAPPNPATGPLNEVQDTSYFNLGIVSGTPLYRDMNNMSFFTAYNNQTGLKVWSSLLELAIWQPGA